MDPAERNELQRAATERVAQRYSWDAVTNAYEALLAGMLRSR
jgi:hypothetical protein